MPNTKSAERRVRNSARKRDHNRAIKSRLKKVKDSFIELLAAGNKAEAAVALPKVSSALDKAAKSGTIHKATARRKRSRLQLALNRLSK